MSDESYPDELHYHEAHDWVRVDGDTATFGITWYAQDTLGEVVFYSPPEVGDTVTKNADYGEGRRSRARAGPECRSAPGRLTLRRRPPRSAA